MTLFKVGGIFPYIIAMFLNAFTDIGHKIIIQNTVFVIYDERTQIILTAIVNALILLPFILLFTPAGYISDRFAKNRVMFYSAALAVVITLLITLCYYLGLFIEAFILTFLLSAQSAIYSPAKYGYIKELVGSDLISAGNAAVQSTTTVAILVSIMFYTVFFGSMITPSEEHDASTILREIAPLGWILVLSSLIELYLASILPDRRSKSLKGSFNFNRYKNGYYLRKNIKIITRIKPIFSAIIALSLFWGISQVMLAVFGAYAKENLHVESVIVVQGVLALSAIGIIAGSIVAAKASKYFINLGLVPFSTIGIFIMIFLIPFAKSIEVVAVLFITFGFFSGFILVPLNAYIQDRSPRTHLGSILAGNNYIQTLFMFIFLLLTTLFAYYGLNSTYLIYIVSGVALILATVTFREHLLMFAWFVVHSLLKVRYRVVFEGVENIPRHGAVLLLGNHISWLDWGLVQFPIERRIRYMIDRDMYNLWFLTPVLKLQNAIPISPRGAKDAFKKAREMVEKKEILCLFPEGGISHSGELEEFRKGFELIAADHKGLIVPFYIDGMWGSRLSRSKEKFVKYRFLFRREIRVYYGEPIPFQSSSQEVREAIEKLIK